jgi:hypothetical protein
MVEAWHKAGINATYLVLEVDHRGTVVEKMD